METVKWVVQRNFYGLWSGVVGKNTGSMNTENRVQPPQNLYKKLEVAMNMPVMPALWVGGDRRVAGLVGHQLSPRFRDRHPCQRHKVESDKARHQIWALCVPSQSNALPIVCGTSMCHKALLQLKRVALFELCPKYLRFQKHQSEHNC